MHIISDVFNAVENKPEIIWMGRAQRSINKRLVVSSSLKIPFIQEFLLCLFTPGDDQKATMLPAHHIFEGSLLSKKNPQILKIITGTGLLYMCDP